MTRLDLAREVAEHLVEYFRPWVDRIEIAGSIRRERPEVGDIEIVAVPQTIPDGLFGDTRLAVPEITHQALLTGAKKKAGAKYIQVLDVMGHGITLDLFLVTPPADWGVIFAIRTGPAAFSHMLVTKALGKLHKVDRGVLWDDRGQRVPCPEEEAFFAALGVPWIEPRERHHLYKAEP